jgi:hypothetical protein
MKKEEQNFKNRQKGTPQKELSLSLSLIADTLFAGDIVHRRRLNQY